MGEVEMEADVTVATADESFLPRMVLRVLLVEPDDSTRQIIAALLRKCSYKVVAAVSDGLMAWETIKDGPHDIDLILTEVELPSISGFALLTLIMEHDICKNIPVIMMSSHDSINTVLKCMIKGAADFLLKPVRKNELRNLWQHVWRRQMLAGEHVPCSLPATEHKFEATAENDPRSNQWSDYGSSILIRKYKEASDTQCLSQLKCMNGNLRDFDRGQQGNVVKLGQELLQNEGQVEENSNRLVKVKEVVHCSEAFDLNASKLEENTAFVKGMTRNDAVGLQSKRGNLDVMVRVGCNEELDEPPTGAIDLIGSFDNQPTGTFPLSSLTDSADEVEFSPQLELCLRRSCFRSTKNQDITERHKLNHSDASAFSWYKNSKSLQFIFPTLAGNQAAMKEGDSKPRQHLKCKIDTLQPHVTRMDCRENLPTPIAGQSKLKFPSTQVGFIPVPGLRMHDMYATCKNISPQVDYGQTRLSPEWRLKPAGQWECSPFPLTTSVHSNLEFNDSDQGYHQNDEATSSFDETVQKKNKQDPVGELRCSSPIADQSACSSLCNGAGNNESRSAHGGVSSGSDPSASASFTAAIDKGTTTASFNDSNCFSHDGLKGMDTLQSSQREAALTKFRLKRKDRCFEKKVRYQSRKRLAEQRPRVKGQFVRQVQNSTPTADADGP
ncbi:hypothetical protein HRI_003767200 [Hibiscus trionum]|uniref:Two-component response regulator-like APRR9 n=1 Tax=Hibiscus trionum TaxID=183268 RepID=A0A9W7IQS7_HIBTR|nr:hypothetical protein HRI_003767200 [Hibiscus trionum]